MPTTSYPSDFSSAAVTEESTPPDIATTTLVSCGRPSISKLLSMVPVIDATAAASEASRSEQSGKSVPSQRDRPVGTRFFNIGHIPVRQSRQPAFGRPKRQILPGGRKGSPEACSPQTQDIEI